MKKQIRRGVFETNSSSVHSLTMCMESDYDRWQEDNLYLLQVQISAIQIIANLKRIISILEKKQLNLRRQTNL